MTKPDTDSIVVRDASDRRRFMRTGAALLLAGGSAAVGRPALADCDRNPSNTEAKQAASGSDSDAGAGADPAGCGRYRHEKPKISRATPPEEPAPVARVAKVRA